MNSWSDPRAYCEPDELQGSSIFEGNDFTHSYGLDLLPSTNTTMLQNTLPPSYLNNMSNFDDVKLEPDWELCVRSSSVSPFPIPAASDGWGPSKPGCSIS
jgi:hypothetical protein